MYLVDTNVISEARKGPRANAGVLGFLSEASPGDHYFNDQTLGEFIQVSGASHPPLGRGHHESR